MIVVPVIGISWYLDAMEPIEERLLTNVHTSELTLKIQILH